jgi:hypothetical protein
MALSTRERTVTLVVLFACAAFVVDSVVIAPYLTARHTLADRKQKQQLELDKAHRILDAEKRLRRKLALLSGRIKPDPAAAEAQLLHLLSDFQQQAGVANASFQRVRTAEDHGYTHLTYHVSATGSMASLAMLLYRIETSAIPLRVDDVQVAPRHDPGDELIVQLNLSTLSKPEKSETGPDAAIAAAEGPR